MKWLNVVLDLNEIFCICQDKRLMPKDQAYVDGSRPHSGIVPYFVGPRQFLFARPMKGSLWNLVMWQISLSGAP
jgi:hypothetical protein